MSFQLKHLVILILVIQLCSACGTTDYDESPSTPSSPTSVIHDANTPTAANGAVVDPASIAIPKNKSENGQNPATGESGKPNKKPMNLLELLKSFWQSSSPEQNGIRPLVREKSQNAIVNTAVVAATLAGFINGWRMWLWQKKDKNDVIAEHEAHTPKTKGKKQTEVKKVLEYKSRSWISLTAGGAATGFVCGLALSMIVAHWVVDPTDLSNVVPNNNANATQPSQLGLPPENLRGLDLSQSSLHDAQTRFHLGLPSGSPDKKNGE